jgi:hypothetical protein
MSDWLHHLLLDNASGLVAAVIATFALLFGIYSARKTAVRSIQPVLVFEYAVDCWYVENVGNGASINILLAFRGDNMPWKCPLRIPPLAKGAKYRIKELGKLSVRHLGASYTDCFRRRYSTLSINDENVVKKGHALPWFVDSKIKRHWGNVSFEEQVDLAYSNERRDSD